MKTALYMSLVLPLAACQTSAEDSNAFRDSGGPTPILADYHGELVNMADLMDAKVVHCRVGEDGWICTDEMVRAVGRSCTLFRDINYRGSTITFTISLNDLTGSGFNDKASSFACYQGAQASLYRDINWRGGSVGGTFSPNLGTAGFNDVTSSVAYR